MLKVSNGLLNGEFGHTGRVFQGPCADAMALEQHWSAFGKQRDLCL
jgi:hypothetical protein